MYVSGLAFDFPLSSCAFSEYSEEAGSAGSEAGAKVTEESEGGSGEEGRRGRLPSLMVNPVLIELEVGVGVGFTSSIGVPGERGFKAVERLLVFLLVVAGPGESTPPPLCLLVLVLAGAWACSAVLEGAEGGVGRVASALALD